MLHMLANSHTPTKDRVEQLVADLLAEAGITAPPVDPGKIARLLDLDVHLDPALVGRGRLVRLRTHAMIHLGPQDRPERLAWTISHEIGEHCMDRMQPASSMGWPELDPWLREQIANQFASALLVPMGWLRPRITGRYVDLHELKRAFASASHEVIACRLLELPMPTVITICDAGKVSRRQGNLHSSPPGLQPLERQTWEIAQRTRLPTLQRAREIAVEAWPIHEPGYEREILRTTLADDMGAD